MTNLEPQKSGWAADTDDLSITDAKIIHRAFRFVFRYDGIEKSMIQGYSDLLDYHNKVANDQRIKQHMMSLQQICVGHSYLGHSIQNDFTESFFFSGT